MHTRTHAGEPTHVCLRSTSLKIANAKMEDGDLLEFFETAMDYTESCIRDASDFIEGTTER